MWQDSGRAKYFYTAFHSVSDWYSGISGNVCFRRPLSHTEIQEPYISVIDGMRTSFVDHMQCFVTVKVLCILFYKLSLFTTVYY